ncbi:MAG: hypothetical protein Q8P22_05810 [Chloroflexota bacterium]|nr:hypothetical protein [Chloroflexota bacterium]
MTTDCNHQTIVVEHGQLHLERRAGCDEHRCLDCGVVVKTTPCRCAPGTLRLGQG